MKLTKFVYFLDFMTIVSFIPFLCFYLALTYMAIVNVTIVVALPNVNEGCLENLFRSSHQSWMIREKTSLVKMMSIAL